LSLDIRLNIKWR